MRCRVLLGVSKPDACLLPEFPFLSDRRAIAVVSTPRQTVITEDRLLPKDRYIRATHGSGDFHVIWLALGLEALDGRMLVD